jgi:hypothetical protein
MRKVVLCLFAALLVVGLPLGALAGTEVYKVKDAPYINAYDGYCFEYPYGPAGAFGENVCISFSDITTSETVRVKYPKGFSSSNPVGTQPDVGWNRVAQGTATVYKISGSFYSVSSFAAKVVGVGSSSPSLGGEVLYTGPFQLEEVVQDDGNKVACWQTMNQEVNFEQCLSDQYDYVMYHWKLTGNSLGSFWKTTVKNGQVCVENAFQNFCESVQQ